MQENKKLEVCSRNEELKEGILRVGSLILSAEKSGNNADEFFLSRNAHGVNGGKKMQVILMENEALKGMEMKRKIYLSGFRELFCKDFS